MTAKIEQILERAYGLAETDEEKAEIVTAIQDYRGMVELANRAYLGLATTGELLKELTARAEINGTIDYKTVDGY